MNASEIKFGIEIETAVPSSATNWDAVDQIQIGGWHHGIKNTWLPGSEPGTFWKCEADGSIRNCSTFGRDRAESPCEFISPVLQGEAGLKNVVDTVAKIKARGARITSTCGIHITVTFPANNSAALARLICLVANFEKGIYASTGTRKREMGMYCKPIKRFGDARKVADRNAYQSPMHDRFHILNLTHLAAGYNRIEFRCFSGSLNVVKLVAWIRIVLGLVERAIGSKKCTPWESKSSTSGRGPWRRKGAGETELVRLFYDLAWTGTYRHRHGDVGGEGVPSFEQCKAALVKMAKKYDEEAAADQVAQSTFAANIAARRQPAPAVVA